MAVISTIIILGIQYLTQIGVLILIDNVVNSLCVIMMSSWYNPHYYLLCKPCHKTVDKCKRYKNQTRVPSNSKCDNEDCCDERTEMKDKVHSNSHLKLDINSKNISK